MFADYWKYDWVLGIVEYNTGRNLVDELDRLVVTPAEDAVRRLAERLLGATERTPKSTSFS